jgi:predicted permease
VLQARHLFTGLMQDIRYAVRVLAAAPGFSFGVIGSLTLGITVSAAAFAIINAMFLRSSPGVDASVVRIDLCRWTERGNCLSQSSSFDDYRAMSGSLRSLAGLSARLQAQVAGRIRGEALMLRAAFVSPNYFDVFGTHLPLGRGFAPAEGDQPVAIISHDMWQLRFQASRSILGEFIDIGTTSLRIVGVAPDDFLGVTRAGAGRDVWMPFGVMDAAAAPVRPSPFSSARAVGQHYIEYVGRLAPGASLPEARAEAEVLAARLAARRSDARERLSARVTRFAMRDWTSERLLEAVAAIMPLPLLVLGIACLNAASLLLARATYRMRETTVRVTLGATRWRVTRYVLIESGMLALAAGVFSVPVTVWAIRVTEPVMPMSIAVDWPVLAFTAAIAAVAALVFGVLPALRASSGSIALGSSRPGDTGAVAPRLRHALVLVQVAASLGLLATGTQSIRAVSNMITTTGAHDPDRLLLASFDLDHLKMTPARGQEFYRQLLDRVAQMPQVEAAGLAPATGLWTFGRGISAAAVCVWRPDDDPKKGQVYLGGYAGGALFDAIGLRLLQGRGFQPEDAGVRPRVAIVNQPLAERIFDGTGVLGRSIRVSANRRHEDAVEVQIVGVVEPTIERSYSPRPVPAIYLPAPLQHEPALTLYVRSRTPLSAFVPDLRQTVAAIDPRVPFVDLASLRTRTEERNFDERILSMGATILGGVAMVLATAGLYGLFSFIVSLRQREIGVRMALGAEPAAILRMVLRQAMRLVLWGSAIGSLIAIIAGAIVTANLFGTPSIDPLMFLASASILLLAMLAAGLIPARRAAQVDPIAVLRQE